MATPRDIDCLRNYFTLDYDLIKCDICGRSYDTEINTEEVREHVPQHVGYENAVSSNTSEEDLKEYYEIRNNTIKCKFCEKLYIPTRSHSIIKHHLGEGHEFGELTTNQISDWLRERNYRLDKSDENQRCYECDYNCENKPISIMNHYRNVHKVDVKANMVPGDVVKENKLDLFYDKWVWNFITKIDEVDAQCGICNVNLLCYREDTRNFKSHLSIRHKDECDVSKIKDIKNHYFEVQDHQLKCRYCKEIFEMSYVINPRLITHLSTHKITDVDKPKKSDTLRNWLNKHVDTLGGFQKSQCKICNKILRKTCGLKLIEHLELHSEIEIPPEITSMRKSSSSPRKSSSSPRKSSSSPRKSSSSLGSKKNIKEIPTSSGVPQAGSSKSSDMEVRDVDHDRDSRRKDLKRKSSDPSSTQPGSSCFPDISDDNERNSGMKRVKYDDDKGAPDKSSSSSTNQCTEIEVLNVPTNVGSTEETYEPYIPIDDIVPNVDAFDNINDLDNIELGSLDSIIGNINRETDQNPHSPNE